MSPGAILDRIRKRIFWRIYFHSVALLIVVAVALGTIVYIIEKKPPRQGAPVRQAKLIASVLHSSLENEKTLQENLDTYQSNLDLTIAVYDASGRAMAFSGPSPPPSLNSDEVSSLPDQSYFHRGSHLYVAALLNPDSADGTYLIMGELSPSGLTRIVASLIVLFLFLIVASFPVSRTIASPLERLTACAKRLSQGDLSARTDIKGSDELGQLGRTLNDMASQLDMKIRREKELLGNISHEIRTPLSRIKVALELSEEETDDTEKIASRLKGISTDITELSQMVEDLLITTRLDLATEQSADGGMILRKDLIDLREVIDAAGRDFSNRHPGHTLKFDLPEPTPFSADPVLLRRVIGNILDNAAKHSHTSQPIELRVAFGEEDVTFETRDRGAGIDAKDLKRIFDPFYRSGKEGFSKDGGVGLGLSLCKRIVEAHGGSIEASSSPEERTVISFSIPK